MPRNKRESSAATFWQLQIFATVVETGSWEVAAERLGINRFHCAKAVNRLAEKLNVDRLLPKVTESLEITEGVRQVAREARRALDAYDAVVRAARDDLEPGLVIRVSAFPAHVAHFLAKAMGQVGLRHPRVRFELDDSHSEFRRRAGAGLARRIEEESSDFIVAPDVAVGSDCTRRPLYRWHLIAAVRAGHPLLDGVSEDDHGPVVDIRHLEGGHLVTAPHGHLSRLLLEQGLQDLLVPISMTSDDPDVLVALGEYTDLIPVIPSDSRVRYLDHWPRLSSEGTPLGGVYSAYWRSTDNGKPALAAVVEELAEAAFRGSDALRELPGGHVLG